MSIEYQDNNYYLSPAECGWVHEDDLPDFSHTRDCLTGMLEALYETGDVDQLERMLDELCHQYDVEFELKDLRVKKI